MSDHLHNYYCHLNRRHFLSKLGLGIGGLALGNLLGCKQGEASDQLSGMGTKGLLDAPHFAPKAKRIIYLFQSGGPSQLDLFDYKPLLTEMHGEELPASVRMGQRLTGMTAFQSNKPLTSSLFKFRQHGQSGAWVSELMPHTAKISDDLCYIKTMHTEAINHDPAITFFSDGVPATPAAPASDRG